MLKKIFFILVFTLFAGLSFASPGFDLSVDKEITVNASQSGFVNIRIASDVSDKFAISIASEKPWLTLQDTQLAVDGGQSKTTKLYFSPLISTPAATYKFTVVAESLTTGAKETADIYATVYKNTFLEVSKVGITGSLEPAGMARIEIYIRNTGRERAPFEIDASILSPSKKKIFVLKESSAADSSEIKVIGKDFPIGDCAEAGEYTISVTLIYKGNEADSFIQKFDVMKKAVMRVSSSERGFVTYEKIYKVENLGNIPGTATLEDKVSGSLFYSGDEPTREKDGSYIWDVELDSCKRKIIEYKVDYSPIVIILLIVFVVWYIVFKFRTFRVRKFIMQKKTIEKGAEFTVGIDMKSFIKAKNVIVKDFVPSVFEVKDTPGLKPHKVKSHSGTQLIWSFPEIKRNEERVLDYKIVPIFGVHGRLHLPQTHVAFDYMLRKVTKKSGKLGIGYIRKEEDKSKRLKEHLTKPKKARPFPRYSFSSFKNIFKKNEDKKKK